VELGQKVGDVAGLGQLDGLGGAVAENLDAKEEVDWAKVVGVESGGNLVLDGGEDGCVAADDQDVVDVDEQVDRM